ncbi:hypothetical protein [Rufibacter tibetensis]|uniref:Uncharacterized protein n=1 Tax=Rufibacter tibetensis TaxID=512763 RepID=A0A0N7HW56_9BACT|nr:hypothetical protein [Rufibacter tibetensis]ALI98312.1 hypothetical protein DC20_04080 [Rufibacter tibetensis]
MKNKWLCLFILFLVFLNGCKKKEQNNKSNYDEIIVQEGFIVKTVESLTGSNNWYFVSAKDINKSDWLGDFKTNNLGNGFWFHPIGHDNFPVSFIEKHMDTLSLPKPSVEKVYTAQLVLFPVRIEYKLKPRFRDKQPRSEFVQNVGGRELRFGFNSLPVNIQKMTPLVEPKREITECKCELKEDDVNGYLYKVCIYLKEQESKYSDVPCTYGVRNIVADTLDGRNVIRVDLNCCYLGDRAYFDPATKELIDFSYGAM